MSIATINPATGQTEHEFTAHTIAEIETRIAGAARAFDELSRTTFEQRGEWLKNAASLLEAEIDIASEMITREIGRPIAASRGEVLKCATGLRYYAQHGAEIMADAPLHDPSLVGASRAFTRYEPLGIILAVMPWNYPLWQVVRFAAPALMAGNTGILKHASNVPLSALYLDTLFERAGFPKYAFATLLIGAGEVASVLDDPRVRAVTLTGSEAAGRAVAGRAAGQVKKAVLELGGSDPFIVLPTADLNAAVSAAVAARIINNGQSCIAAKRFIVHTDAYDQFVPRFTAAMAALIVGDPMNPATQIGPISTESGRNDLSALVVDAIEQGAEVLTGGELPAGPGWFYPPTVLAGITPAMRVHQEETFGPVATVYRVESLDEAIAVANGTSFGLSSAAFTNDEKEQRRLMQEIQAGAVFLNGISVSYPELPFGGIKNSGYGRELAAIGMREFCNLKTVWMR